MSEPWSQLYFDAMEPPVRTEGPSPLPVDRQPIPILAVDARSNARLMAQCALLGHLDGVVADVTYNTGKFWREFRPPGLLAFDLDPRFGVTVADCRHLPLEDGSVDAVVFDPPYKLNGTVFGTGAGSADLIYGVESGVTRAERTLLLINGIVEATRVARRRVLVKCMDQVNGGKLQLQTFRAIDTALNCGWRTLDVFHNLGYRAQPAGTRQVHARRNHSTLLVFCPET